MTDPLLTAVEVSELLGLSSGTVLDRFERGDLPGFRLFGRKGGPVRFRLSEIEEMLEAWRCGPESGTLSSTYQTDGRAPRKRPRPDTEGVTFDAHAD